MNVSMNGARTNGETMSQSTVVALFEDGIDAEHALLALRKANQSANRVSLLVRSRQDERGSGDRPVDVARDIVAVALGAVANWLIGLAELIVTERGRYLVAGPMGAALTGIRQASASNSNTGETNSSFLMATDLSADSLQWVLTEFGFTAKEAEYVEHRLTAGATLVAMTSNDPAEIETARHEFSAHDAVYIGTAETDAGVLEATRALLAAGPELSGTHEAAIVDAVALLRPATEETGPSDLAALRGLTVVCEGNVESGEIDRVIVEDAAAVTPDDDLAPVSPTPRYVVVAFGGVLGLGRRKVAVPIGLTDLTENPVRLRVDKATLQLAPAYDEDVPLGRREEDRIFRYFDLTPYWTEADTADPALMAGGRETNGSDRERDGSG